MLRIYDDCQIRRYARLRRLQVLVLLSVGIAIGSWWTELGRPLPALDEATAADAVTTAPLPTAPWCQQGENPSILRLDCALSPPRTAIDTARARPDP